MEAHSGSESQFKPDSSSTDHVTSKEPPAPASSQQPPVMTSGHTQKAPPTNPDQDDTDLYEEMVSSNNFRTGMAVSRYKAPSSRLQENNSAGEKLSSGGKPAW